MAKVSLYDWIIAIQAAGGTAEEHTKDQWLWAKNPEMRKEIELKWRRYYYEGRKRVKGTKV